MITIFGYGSLQSQESLRVTCPSAINHRLAVLPGWKRVFSLVSVGSIVRQQADFTKNQLAALAIRPSPHKDTEDGKPQLCVGAVFDISMKEFDALKLREHRYDFATVEVFDIVGVDKVNLSDSVAYNAIDSRTPIKAFVVIESTDDIYKAKCNQEDIEKNLNLGDTYRELVEQHYSGQLWGREDILPVIRYLKLCLNASIELGGNWGRDNFLDRGYLANGEPVRTFWNAICEEEALESAKQIKGD
jgi:cation transport regulator ChaC